MLELDVIIGDKELLFIINISYDTIQTLASDQLERWPICTNQAVVYLPSGDNNIFNCEYEA